MMHSYVGGHYQALSCKRNNFKSSLYFVTNLSVLELVHVDATLSALETGDRLSKETTGRQWPVASDHKETDHLVATRWPLNIAALPGNSKL